MKEMNADMTPKEFARQAHKGQISNNGEPYVNHLARVASKFDSEKQPFQYAAAWLHGIFEHTDITFDELEEEFGLRIASIVDSLTQRESERIEDYLDRIFACFEAVDVKLADLEDDLSPKKKKTIIL